MASAHPIKNTSKPYQCTTCGSDNVSVIREDPSGVNPRLKCNACQFLFNGQDSLAAIDAGAIQPSSAESLADASEPDVETLSPSDRRAIRDPSHPLALPTSTLRLPDRPGFVFLSKPRDTLEFCTKRDFKKTALKWSDKKFDVYELKPVKLSVDVNIS